MDLQTTLWVRDLSFLAMVIAACWGCIGWLHEQRKLRVAEQRIKLHIRFEVMLCHAFNEDYVKWMHELRKANKGCRNKARLVRRVRENAARYAYTYQPPDGMPASLRNCGVPDLAAFEKSLLDNGDYIQEGVPA